MNTYAYPKIRVIPPSSIYVIELGINSLFLELNRLTSQSHDALVRIRV